ncbi:MAG TPA: hypothetical protein VK638_48740 [Edaphobacter sp.]|nr:hypothetical protein [Edaphobacter sp.]
MPNTISDGSSKLQYDFVDVSGAVTKNSPLGKEHEGAEEGSESQKAVQNMPEPSSKQARAAIVQSLREMSLVPTREQAAGQLWQEGEVPTFLLIVATSQTSEIGHITAGQLS